MLPEHFSAMTAIRLPIDADLKGYIAASEQHSALLALAYSVANPVTSVFSLYRSGCLTSATVAQSICAPSTLKEAHTPLFYFLALLGPQTYAKQSMIKVSGISRLEKLSTQMYVGAFRIRWCGGALICPL